MTFPAWFDEERATLAFTLEHPPIEFRLEFSAIPDNGIAIVLNGFVGENHVVRADRWIAAVVGDELRAYHQIFIVSNERMKLQRGGIATQMMTRCIPYYREIGVRYVVIPCAVGPGKTVWPKFGFTLLEELFDEYREAVMDIYGRKTGAYGAALLSKADIPVRPGFAEFATPLVADLGGIALIEMESVGYKLDLDDGDALECLARRGVRP